MAGLSASGLKTQIRSYTEVDTNVLSDSVLENIILNAQYRIFRDVPIDADRKTSTGNFTSGTVTVTEVNHGRSNGNSVRFRGPIHTSSDSDGFENPKGFDGVTGANLAKSAGYSITVGKRDSSGNITNTTDFYHFTVDTNTATSGGVSGGGNSCSAGPATLTA